MIASSSDSPVISKPTPAAATPAAGSALAQYEARETRYRADATRSRQRMNRWSNWRLLIFVLAVAGLVYSVKNDRPLLVVLFLASGIKSFVAAVLRHNHHTRSFDRATRLQRINQEGIQRCKGEWQQREGATGEGFAGKSHPYASDLDLFGKNSVFQWFNTTRTPAGQQRLAQMLLDPVSAPKEVDALRQRQEAVQELAQKLDWRQQLEAEGMGLEGKDFKPLLEWGEAPLRSSLFSKAIRVLRGLPILTAILWLAAWLGGAPELSALALVVLVIQALAAGVLSRRYQPGIEQALSWENDLTVCKKLFELVLSERFSSSFNQELQRSLQASSEKADGLSATAALGRVETLLSWLSMRHNPMVHFVFNTLVMWDLQWLVALEKWRRDHGKFLRPWLDRFAELEALASLSVIRFEHEDWAWPEVETSVPLQATRLGHPLLPEGKRVTNDFSIEVPGSVAIITGSNMSGKSTFLRTVGLNLVLANAGAPVCAQSFRFTPMRLFTSMRIADDMGSGVSSFYAELLRVKMMVDAAREGPMLYLVDEIFRGTNSGDRVAGAIEVLKSLSKTQAVGLVSTHDLELSKLAQTEGDRFRNFHFSERFTEDGIEFSYAIQPGPATTTNARQLIRMVGISVGD